MATDIITNPGTVGTFDYHALAKQAQHIDDLQEWRPIEAKELVSKAFIIADLKFNESQFGGSGSEHNPDNEYVTVFCVLEDNAQVFFSTQSLAILGTLRGATAPIAVPRGLRAKLAKSRDGQHTFDAYSFA